MGGGGGGGGGDCQLALNTSGLKHRLDCIEISW